MLENAIVLIGSTAECSELKYRTLIMDNFEIMET